MAIVRWNPWSLPSIFDEDFDFPILPALGRGGQGLNLYETDTAVMAEAAFPGVPEDKIDVSVDGGVVRVTGSYEKKEEEKGKRKYFMSLMTQSYNYSFRLPETVDWEKEPKAELENGVLTLTFPKKEVRAPKKIQVSKKGK